MKDRVETLRLNAIAHSTFDMIDFPSFPFWLNSAGVIITKGGLKLQTRYNQVRELAKDSARVKVGTTAGERRLLEEGRDNREKRD